jgi:hypothetical protein
LTTWVLKYKLFKKENDFDSFFDHSSQGAGRLFFCQILT